MTALIDAAKLFIARKLKVISAEDLAGFVHAGLTKRDADDLLEEASWVGRADISPRKFIEEAQCLESFAYEFAFGSSLIFGSSSDKLAREFHKCIELGSSPRFMQKYRSRCKEYLAAAEPASAEPHTKAIGENIGRAFAGHFDVAEEYKVLLFIYGSRKFEGCMQTTLTAWGGYRIL